MVRPVDTIGFGLGPANPDTFLTALGSRDDWRDLQVGGALCLNFYEVFTKPGVSYRCGFFGPAERLLYSMGHRVELVPGGFRQMAPILAKFSPRIMVVQAAPPDEAGTISLSLHLGATRPELVRAGEDPDRLLIVEVNPNLPRTKSLPPQFDNTIPLDLVDVLVETNAVPFALADPLTDEVDAAIARNALSYVKNGSTLQTGIGAIPNIVATELAKGPLGGFGVHSEMFTNGLMRLHKAGKVTNDAKGAFDGVSVTTFALGTSELYGWLDGNARGRLPPGGDGERPHRHRPERQPRLHQRGPRARPLRPGGGRQHRRQADLGRGRPRGLHVRRRSAPRRTLARLPPLDDGARRQRRVPDRRAPDGRLGRLHAASSHARRRHGVRGRRANRPDRARTGASPRRHRPPRLPQGPAYDGRPDRARAELGVPPRSAMPHGCLSSRLPASACWATRGTWPDAGRSRR